jgi:hypothetical protein
MTDQQPQQRGVRCARYPVEMGGEADRGVPGQLLTAVQVDVGAPLGQLQEDLGRKLFDRGLQQGSPELGVEPVDPPRQPPAGGRGKL